MLDDIGAGAAGADFSSVSLRDWMGTSAGSSSAGAASVAAGCSAAGVASACGVFCSSSLLPHAESSEQDRAMAPISDTDCSFMAKLRI